MRKLLLALALLWPVAASAQFQSGGGFGGGGSGSGSGSVSFSTTCPASTQSGSSITFTNSLTDIPKTGSYAGSWTTDCGAWLKFTLSASATYTLPAPSTDGNYIPIITNTPTSTSPLTIAAASGTINGASSITLAIGQSISVSCDTTNCFAATVSPTAPMGPGYAVGPWYVPWYTATTGTGTVATAVTTTYCSPNWISNINAAGGGSGTIGSITLYIPTTVGTTNSQIALYAASSTGYPGLLVANTGNIPDTSTGATTAAITASVTQGMYWWCQQTNDTTVRYTVASSNIQKGFLVGSSSNTTIASNTYQQISTPGTFGTWPADLSAATWSNITTTAALVQFQFSSIP